jgi:hypothetical protein
MDVVFAPQAMLPGTRVTARLRFHGVSNLRLADFNYQNVLGSMGFERDPISGLACASVEGVFGLEGRFNFESGEVSDVTIES